jgi:hypothetical protein
MLYCCNLKFKKVLHMLWFFLSSCCLSLTSWWGWSNRSAKIPVTLHHLTCTTAVSKKVWIFVTWCCSGFSWILSILAMSYWGASHQNSHFQCQQQLSPFAIHIANFMGDLWNYCFGVWCISASHISNFFEDSSLLSFHQ